jgi:iron complex transport system substrate-binding protein
MRVVSLVPSVTEVIYALGAEAALVGNTNQCDYPEAAKQVPKVGDFLRPDVERIVSLRPTLVFATLPMHQQLLEKLAELGVRTYVSRPENLAGVMAEIDSIGTLLGRRPQAESLVAAMRARLDSLPAVTDSPTVFAEISSAPLVTTGGRTFINELIQRAGGRNVFADVLQEYPAVDAEAVVSRNPDVILLLHPDVKADEVRDRVGWQKIRAVQSNRVYEGLDDDLFFRPGPRVVDGVETLYRVLHKE